MSDVITEIGEIDKNIYENMAITFVKTHIDEHIMECYNKLNIIRDYITNRDEAKQRLPHLNHDEMSVYFGRTESIRNVNIRYQRFLESCNTPGVRTVLEIYASQALPKPLKHKLTATIQAHSSENTRVRLPTNNVLTLSVSGRPGEPGIMKIVPKLTTIDDTHSAELDSSKRTWKMNISKILKQIVNTFAIIVPQRVNTYIHEIAHRHQPKIYGIDFWWSWYIHNFGLYEDPTEETRTSLYNEYYDLYSKMHNPPTIKSVAHLATIKNKINSSTNKTANLYNLARFLRSAWAGADITFPGGGFNVICAHRDREHHLKPNDLEPPDFCPTYGISVAETTDPADHAFTNSGLKFLKYHHQLDGDAASIQEYRDNPHLADGANFAPMPEHMLDNVSKTYEVRCSVTIPNVNLLDQQLYWLNKILVFCEGNINEMVYYALLFLEMCVYRRTTHSAMINMFQQGMGYVFTCLDPSCRYIPIVSDGKVKLPAMSMQVLEYTNDLKLIEDIVGVQPTEPTVKECAFVRREFNESGICSNCKQSVNKEEDDMLRMIKDDYKNPNANTATFKSIVTTLLEIADNPKNIKIYQLLFERYKDDFDLYRPPQSRRSHSPPKKMSRRSPRSRLPLRGGKLYSTRKCIMPARRRKNNQCSTYKKNKKKYN